MTELWLNFRDETERERRVAVDSSHFTIGRQPGNDLTIPDSRLSRTHLKIDRFGDVFVASDCGSSNGSTVNGSPLTDPVPIRDGDKLVLGGGIEISAEIVAPEVESRRRRKAGPEAEQAPASIPTAIFIAAPVLVVLILVCGGGLIYLTNGGQGKDVVTDLPRTPFPTPEDSDTPERPTPEPTAVENRNTGPTGTSPTPISDDSRLIEQHAAKFLRAIALSDPNAFLTTPQVEIVKGRIGPFKGSGALASNLNSVRSNKSQFESMATSQGLKPQFLAAAALTKIGNKQGDPVATARSMLPFLGDLRISLGNSLADDNLLIMADYPRRESNSGRSLQSILEGIPRSKIGDADPREIRTIWFLRKNDKISETAYDFALRFIVIGAIMQNPKDFGVNAEPVIF